MKLIGFTAPRFMGGDSRPGGFALLVFGSLEAPQMAEGLHTVRRFWPVALEAKSIQPLPESMASAEIDVGATALLCFQHRDGSLVVGDYSQVAASVRSQWANFNDLPFTQSDMASFLRDPVLGEDALARCAALFEAERPGSGAVFRRNNPFRPMPPEVGGDS